MADTICRARCLRSFLRRLQKSSADCFVIRLTPLLILGKLAKRIVTQR